MSQMDDIVAEIETAYDDATVAFAVGGLRKNEFAQQRTILLVRQSGTLQFAKSPERRGFAATATNSLFTRHEVIECTLRAEDEEALDVMLDRFVHTLFRLYGSNVLQDVNRYNWYGEDSENSYGFERRNPAIKLMITLQLVSVDRVGDPYSTVASVDGAITELDNTVNPPTAS